MKMISENLVPILAVTGAAFLALVACEKRDAQVSAPAASTSVGTEIDDAVVTTRVKSALLADHDTQSLDIKVETRKGTVQLSGFVASQERIDKAIALVRKVEGVKGVENGMSLKDGKATVGEAVDDSILTTRIKSALLADPDVKSFDIAVVSRKGEVQLSGYVDNRAQIDRVIEVVRGVSGVQKIDNAMTVKK